MTAQAAKIIYTITDEAPALATAAFLPVVQKFTAAAGIAVESRDISLAGRILAVFSDLLPPNQRLANDLQELGQLTLKPEASIIKLPNISATVVQLVAAIKELQAKGYALPDFPEQAKSDQERAIRDRYAQCIGSSVNPVLREGNSDRRAPKAVKAYARKHPHSMGAWSQSSRTHVAHMRTGDFYHGEQSLTLDRPRVVQMELQVSGGQTVVLKPKVSLLAGEIVDSMFMSKKALADFFEKEINDAQQSGLLFSLHLKATMMKVSDPIMFGLCVRTFYKEVFAKHAKVFQELGVNVNNGMLDLYQKIEKLPVAQRDEIKRDIESCQKKRPELAMVDSDKGVTNFHSPNDVIVDASMPAMIRQGGKMWGTDGQLKDVKAVIPDSTFARIYQEIINFCKWHGNFDPRTMGTVPNVGLMAQQAEEYGSHDKTFEIQQNGLAQVRDIENGEILFSQAVEVGDIWRLCQVKDAPIKDWVKLAVTRARQSGMPAVFWLDPYRPHERELIKKVQLHLRDHDTTGLEIEIMSQVRAMRYSLERVARGLDTIAVTGNILRDYLTDLFPILELGTSAKMLSIVPLMAGGCMYETGAGGSAPRQVQQLVEENHLRWDSLGEFLALAVALEDLGLKHGQSKATVLAVALDAATGRLLDQNKGPSNKTMELDNRGSQFYLTMYWAQELSKQSTDLAVQKHFAPIAKFLSDNETKIVEELKLVQGKPVTIDGYYFPDRAKLRKVMLPSATFNQALGLT